MPSTFHLDAFLSGHVFAFLLLFARIGAVIMLFPGIGDTYVPPRIRLAFALSISALLLEPMLPRLPAMPSQPGALASLLMYEIVIGLFFGTLIRVIVSTLEAAGSVIGMETGLSSATLLNPALATQSTLPSAFLTLAGMALIFVTGADRFLFRCMAALYDFFPAGGTLMPGDMARVVIDLVNRSFTVGIELAAPFFIMGLLMYTAFGILQRLMPQVQVFLVALPLQIWGGLLLFSLTVTTMMTIWLKFLDHSLGSFFQG
ncbi:MAG: flagellar biosynthetic protein FliR [Alphaproteobacteria bacterium]|nr:flagellar biosynthetic protein FliR [Alphaproteobacteria bacterium]